MPPHTELALNGVEVFLNASGSHHQLRKLDLRLRAFIGATHTRGGVYMYSNHQGCDGGRLYYGIVCFCSAQVSLNYLLVIIICLYFPFLSKKNPSFFLYERT